MTKISLFLVLSISLFIVACSSVQLTPEATSQPTQTSLPTEEATPIPPTIIAVTEQLPQETNQPQMSVGVDCLGTEDSRMGHAIADEYEFTSYEQVMSWFCNGAEFEDILVALQTEEQIGTPAEELLVMLADGFTWDEIWKVVGLTD